MNGYARVAGYAVAEVNGYGGGRSERLRGRPATGRPGCRASQMSRLAHPPRPPLWHPLPGGGTGTAAGSMEHRPGYFRVSGTLTRLGKHADETAQIRLGRKLRPGHEIDVRATRCRSRHALPAGALSLYTELMTVLETASWSGKADDR
jgi:hypothetical protein